MISEEGSSSFFRALLIYSVNSLPMAQTFSLVMNYSWASGQLKHCCSIHQGVLLFRARRSGT
ncbi:hypothetical protein [Pontibacter burrus]|uniref:Uncharacterized protein n=1 Tax=Pontibacter burrus TaxID=2704466 RepID=A0A6B3LXA8_9BACT|nr:hypothetical protein [Pontibacter burrus]NEM98448.1 hypothetical protein [Pontibacter burrus]